MSETVHLMTVAAADAQLKAYIERIERIAEEIKALQEDVNGVYAEAKGNGYDVKIIRQIVRLRKMDSAELSEQEALLALYMEAIGMRHPGGAA